MDQARFADVEERIICPYDQVVVHEVSRLRMGTHLQRCRRNHMQYADQLVTCSFNYTHKIPKLEIEFHETICPDRETFYTHEYAVGNQESSTVQQLMENASKPLEIPSSESWDLEVTAPDSNVLNAIEKSAEDRGVIRNHQNMAPAERKLRREEDRQKMKARLNAEELAKMNKGHLVSSVVPTDSEWPALSGKTSASKAGPSSACSVMSDATYTTALNTVTDKMREFQVVTKKKGRGRAAKLEMEKGVEKAVEAPFLCGVGRGRGRGSRPQQN